jgi:hypothetical protein
MQGKQFAHIAPSLICEPSLNLHVASKFLEGSNLDHKILGGLEMRGKSKQRFRALSLAGAA